MDDEKRRISSRHSIHNIERGGRKSGLPDFTFNWLAKKKQIVYHGILPTRNCLRNNFFIAVVKSFGVKKCIQSKYSSLENKGFTHEYIFGNTSRYVLHVNST